MNDICVQLWNSKDKDFKDYVEKYIFKHHITFKEALEHEMVREYAEYIMEERRRGRNR